MHSSAIFFSHIIDSRQLRVISKVRETNSVTELNTTILCSLCGKDRYQNTRNHQIVSVLFNKCQSYCTLKQNEAENTAEVVNTTSEAARAHAALR